ncbi:hypothetical protein LEP1GSC186_1185 [Leptospira noguchii serovar Autumnalis str. ZUN142]|uniref:Uncharacterized protein n=1 Tax=Leptospira noguchii serovar Autumnalis str. ZUN142 TaxID=1085540 RepID=M6UEI9_9LEPT|nr:hypothetical protein LEP1GSC186_1185 [Leptospira noguchii serovar Autumnalis str. ZUN142]
MAAGFAQVFLRRTYIILELLKVLWFRLTELIQTTVPIK